MLHRGCVGLGDAERLNSRIGMAACVLEFLLCEFNEVIWEVAPLADPAFSQACSTERIGDLNGREDRWLRLVVEMKQRGCMRGVLETLGYNNRYILPDMLDGVVAKRRTTFKGKIVCEFARQFLYCGAVFQKKECTERRGHAK